ncbi:Conserved_hypothetical protein [Hexamita inflata]|uniref:Uncharacterized protein n=1 Tax=Hexamita inflata TaxID=28002 RepID=A0AA86RGD7_9EUKA|nr:Conserved hypothetical protein [Hexamita inflata]
MKQIPIFLQYSRHAVPRFDRFALYSPDSNKNATSIKQCLEASQFETNDLYCLQFRQLPILGYVSDYLIPSDAQNFIVSKSFSDSTFNTCSAILKTEFYTPDQLRPFSDQILPDQLSQHIIYNIRNPQLHPVLKIVNTLSIKPRDQATLFYKAAVSVQNVSKQQNSILNVKQGNFKDLLVNYYGDDLDVLAHYVQQPDQDRVSKLSHELDTYVNPKVQVLVRNKFNHFAILIGEMIHYQYESISYPGAYFQVLFNNPQQLNSKINVISVVNVQTLSDQINPFIKAAVNHVLQDQTFNQKQQQNAFTNKLRKQFRDAVPITEQPIEFSLNIDEDLYKLSKEIKFRNLFEQDVVLLLRILATCLSSMRFRNRTHFQLSEQQIRAFKKFSITQNELCIQHDLLSEWLIEFFQTQKKEPKEVLACPSLYGYAQQEEIPNNDLYLQFQAANIVPSQKQLEKLLTKPIQTASVLCLLNNDNRKSVKIMHQQMERETFYDQFFERFEFREYQNPTYLLSYDEVLYALRSDSELNYKQTEIKRAVNELEKYGIQTNDLNLCQVLQFRLYLKFCTKEHTVFTNSTVILTEQNYVQGFDFDKLFVEQFELLIKKFYLETLEYVNQFSIYNEICAEFSLNDGTKYVYALDEFKLSEHLCYINQPGVYIVAQNKVQQLHSNGYVMRKINNKIERVDGTYMNLQDVQKAFNDKNELFGQINNLRFKMLPKCGNIPVVLSIVIQPTEKQIIKNTLSQVEDMKSIPQDHISILKPEEVISNNGFVKKVMKSGDDPLRQQVLICFMDENASVQETFNFLNKKFQFHANERLSVMHVGYKLTLKTFHQYGNYMNGEIPGSLFKIDSTVQTTKLFEYLLRENNLLYKELNRRKNYKANQISKCVQFGDLDKVQKLALDIQVQDQISLAHVIKYVTQPLTHHKFRNVLRIPQILQNVTKSCKQFAIDQQIENNIFFTSVEHVIPPLNQYYAYEQFLVKEKQLAQFKPEVQLTIAEQAVADVNAIEQLVYDMVDEIHRQYHEKPEQERLDQIHNDFKADLQNCRLFFNQQPPVTRPRPSQYAQLIINNKNDFVNLTESLIQISSVLDHVLKFEPVQQDLLFIHQQNALETFKSPKTPAQNLSQTAKVQFKSPQKKLSVQELAQRFRSPKKELEFKFIDKNNKVTIPKYNLEKQEQQLKEQIKEQNIEVKKPVRPQRPDKPKSVKQEDAKKSLREQLKSIEERAYI